MQVADPRFQGQAGDELFQGVGGAAVDGDDGLQAGGGVGFAPDPQAGEGEAAAREGLEEEGADVGLFAAVADQVDGGAYAFVVGVALGDLG